MGSVSHIDQVRCPSPRLWHTGQPCVIFARKIAVLQRRRERTRRVSSGTAQTQTSTKPHSQRDLATQPGLAADAHPDERRVRLVRELEVVVRDGGAVGVHDVPAEEEQVEPVRRLRERLAAEVSGSGPRSCSAVSSIRVTREEEPALEEEGWAEEEPAAMGRDV